MKFAPKPTLAILSTVACLLLTGCGLSTPTSTYSQAKITVGKEATSKIEIAAPEITTATPTATPVPSLAVPGEITLPTNQPSPNKSAPSTVQTAPLCEGVTNEIAVHFKGLLKCDQLSKLIDDIRGVTHSNTQQLLTMILAWKNEYCVERGPDGVMPIYPDKPGGPKHEAMPMPYDNKTQQSSGEPLVYIRQYVPCSLGNDLSDSAK
jgi:hypothetical protein